MINQLLAELHQCVENPENEQVIPMYAGRIQELADDETVDLFKRLVQFAKEIDDSIWPRLLVVLLGIVPQSGSKPWPSDACQDHLEELYQICPPDHFLRNHLLAWIANQDAGRANKLWTDLICSDPPQTSEGIAIAFSPLLTDDAAVTDIQLSRLINEATGNMHVAAAVYDLCNHAFRKGKVANHPASGRSNQICDLLGALIGKLSLIEEGNLPQGDSPETIAQTVSNAVALIIALTDTVALLKEDQAIGKLHQALELRHRRIQVEAAAALALMDDENGKQKLIECAQHPVVRRRVIAYARELGFENEISLEYKGPIATAESHLAMWLAEPAQMGIAPTTVELIDQRELYWPSYEDRVACFLFQYHYGLGDNSHKNIGISGPVTHAFSADLTELSITDQYAAFAGWQTVSDEIFLIPLERAEKLLPVETDSLSALGQHLIDSVAIQSVSGFFSKYVLVATGTKEGNQGTIIVDEERSDWFSSGNERTPIDWRMALDIWRGRKLLSSFNPAFSS